MFKKIYKMINNVYIYCCDRNNYFYLNLNILSNNFYVWV